MNDRSYHRKKELVRKYVRKNKTFDTSRILNEVNIDYDTLSLVLADLRKEGFLRT
jgi:predicted transcriptional regulator